MKVSDKAIVFGVLIGALAIGFYLMLLAPKREKATELNGQIEQLHASISQEEQVASFAEQARKDFPRYYGRLVVLGKAVPQQADTASLLVQLNSLAGRNNIDFRSIELGSDSASSGTGTASTTPTASAASSSTSAAPDTTTPSTGSTTPSTGATTSTSTTSTTSATPVPATESAAASLPIGAVVGPAGLATLPYTLQLKGGYFDIANFIGGIDDLVQPTDAGARVSPDGRLFTVDGFSVSGGLPGSSPLLKANFSVTTYATPADEGLTLGATPSGPASPLAPGAAPAQPASAVVAK